MSHDMKWMVNQLTIDLLQDPLAMRGGGGVQYYGLMLEADSCEYDYNLADSWVSEKRWSSLTQQYLDGDALEQWIELITRKLTHRRAHGVAFLRSKIVQPRGVGTKRVSRQWGSCMIGWSFRVFPKPMLTMHSRSTYLGFLAPLDLGVAAILAEEVGAELGLTPDEIGFTWFLEQATFHFMRSMPWWSTPAAQEIRKLTTPGAHGGRRMIERFRKMDKEGVLYGDMAYAQERRYRMKMHSQSKKPPSQYLGPGKHADIKSNPPIWPAHIKELPFLTG